MELPRAGGLCILRAGIPIASIPMRVFATAYGLLSILYLSVLSSTDEAGGEVAVRDRIWIWGNPEMAEMGPHTAASFAQASPAERARILGASNVILAGAGLPRDERKAESIARSVADFPRIVWEIAADSPEGGPPFEYRETIRRLAPHAKDYPAIEAVLLDDMSSIGIDKGFKPEHIGKIRKLLDEHCPRIKTWGVVYTMNFDRPDIEDYMRELDVISLWTWHAKDVVNLEQNVARVRESFPGKPIVVGLYLYDYGEGRRMPMDLLELQCETALSLLSDGQVQGLVFLTIVNDVETVEWSARWIERVGDRKISVGTRFEE